MSARKEPTLKSRAASRNLTRIIERTSPSLWSESLSAHLHNEIIQYPDGRVELSTVHTEQLQGFDERRRTGRLSRTMRAQSHAQCRGPHALRVQLHLQTDIG